MPEPSLSSKELRGLRSRFKRGFTLETIGQSNRLRVINPQGEPVRLDGGRPLTLHQTPSAGAWADYERQLRDAGVLKQNGKRKPKPTDEQSKRRSELLRRAIEERSRKRAVEAKALHDRLALVLKPLGGFELPGNQADAAHIAAMLGREMGEEAKTYDLYAPSFSRVHNGGWVETRYQRVWNELAQRLEQAEDLHETWFALVRQSRGIREDAVQVRKPVEGDWPFRVELLPIEALLVDHDFQRPADWYFVRREAARFDSSLVGTIDVSERRKGAVYSILDGQQRMEICKLVGLETIYCSIYSGLDKASEARFFLHKNKDRKTVHPFYTWRARLVAADPDALEIEKIVKRMGFRMAITSAKVGTKSENHISAVMAVQNAYELKRPDGGEALSATLATLYNSTFGMEQGQANVLIRGLARFFTYFDDDELDLKHLEQRLTERGPTWLLTRTRETSRAMSTGGGAEHYLARVLIEEYNRGLDRGSRLEKRL
jgi:uncharacterized protein DUF6551